MEVDQSAAVTDEVLWAGWYGIQYTTKFAVNWRERIPFLRSVIEQTAAKSVLDVGTNAGWNLRALRDVDPSVKLAGAEINPHVAVTASSMEFDVEVCAAREVGQRFPKAFDLVMTSGVLIHVPPHLIGETMSAIIAASKRWILAVEYPAPQETVVRSHVDVPRAWARPYGRLYEDAGLRVVGHGVPEAGYPECAWWLMEKP